MYLYKTVYIRFWLNYSMYLEEKNGIEESDRGVSRLYSSLYWVWGPIESPK